MSWMSSKSKCNRSHMACKTRATNPFFFSCILNLNRLSVLQPSLFIRNDCSLAFGHRTSNAPAKPFVINKEGDQRSYHFCPFQQYKIPFRTLRWLWKEWMEKKRRKETKKENFVWNYRGSDYVESGLHTEYTMAMSVAARTNEFIQTTV